MSYDEYLMSEDCPVCGPTTVTAVHDGNPSMLGFGYDPDVIDLACGHRLTFDPFTGEPSARPIPQWGEGVAQ